MVAFLRSLAALLITSPSSDNIPPTPCIRICRYNADFYDGQVCIGCFREAFEISQWSSPGMSNVDRSYALLDASDRVDLAFEGSISKEELLRQAQAWRDL
jgi:predicted Fe-S protein YdhL (DUF1289 family)